MLWLEFFSSLQIESFGIYPRKYSNWKWAEMEPFIWFPQTLKIWKKGTQIWTIPHFSFAFAKPKLTQNGWAKANPKSLVLSIPIGSRNTDIDLSGCIHVITIGITCHAVLTLHTWRKRGRQLIDPPWLDERIKTELVGRWCYSLKDVGRDNFKSTESWPNSLLIGDIGALPLISIKAANIESVWKSHPKFLIVDGGRKQARDPTLSTLLAWISHLPSLSKIYTALSKLGGWLKSDLLVTCEMAL